jgi:glycosyltransferase 2 family protein
VELAAETDGYARRRLAEARAGQLAITVDHADLLVLPRRPSSRLATRVTSRAASPVAERSTPGRSNVAAASSSRSGARMRPTVWAWARLLGAAATFTVLVWRLGAGPFRDGLRAVDGRALAAAAGLAVLTTVCCAWRWKIVARGLGVDLSLPAAVAAYYRSLFLNVTLPGGVLGDIHRGVSHGRDVRDVGRGLRAVVWERSAGQAVQVVLTVVLLLALPSPVHSSMPLVAIAIVVAALGAVLVARVRPGGGRSRWARVRTAAAGDIRHGLLARRAWLGITVASAMVVAGHAVTFLIAARTAGITAPPSRMLPLALLVMLAMVLPSVGGWGPREGATAWVFGAAGLGAAQGVATAVVYGVMVLVASLPGAAFLVVPWLRRIRPPGRPEPPLQRGVPVAVRPEGDAHA